MVDDEARTIASTRYGYDVLGRRTLVQDNGTTTLRTLYDGLGFDVVKESPVYASGGFTDTYNTGIQYSSAGRATGERYRYLDDGATATSGKYQYIEDSAYQTVFSRYSSERTMLYAYGSPVAINRASGTRGYLGTDILGSTRSVTDNHGVQESYYDYDIFGSPVAGDFTTGADYGYLGKPYDSITGLYNYGYRDYSPQSVRFTTVDPIRDGANWFAYVNNDPVNYVDLWGLLASEPYTKKTFNTGNGNYSFDVAYLQRDDSATTSAQKVLYAKGDAVMQFTGGSGVAGVSIEAGVAKTGDKNNNGWGYNMEAFSAHASFKIGLPEGDVSSGVNIVSWKGAKDIGVGKITVEIGIKAELGIAWNTDTDNSLTLDLGPISINMSVGNFDPLE